MVLTLVCLSRGWFGEAGWLVKGKDRRNLRTGDTHKNRQLIAGIVFQGEKSFFLSLFQKRRIVFYFLTADPRK